MPFRLNIIRKLYALPYFRGRDRLISALTRTFENRPLQLSSGLQMLLDPVEYLQLDIAVRGCAEPMTLNLVTKIVGPGGCVIDVGAHIGQHALEAARASGSKGKVFAFDPQPYNADRIGRHAVINGMANITSVCAAVGDKNGYIGLPMQSEQDRARLSLDEPGPSNLNALVEVPLRRLDTFISDHGIGQLVCSKSMLKVTSLRCFVV